MSRHYGIRNAGSTLYVYFDSFDSNGGSVTLTGLAATDVEIYKNGSITQRSSDAGITLLDTDGIDFDGAVGIHGFSIDLSDDTDSGFYEPGASYAVVVNSVTIDTQTVRFIAAEFDIGTIEQSTAKAGTLSVTQMSTNLTETTNDHYIGRTVIWLTGPLKNQASDITDYVGTNGVLTYSTVTDVPQAGDGFIIV